MACQVSCECGYVMRAATEDEVVELTQVHISRDHPALAGTVRPEDIRGWIEIVG